MPVNLEIFLDELNIGKSIVKGLQAYCTSRDKFVNSLCDKTFEAAKSRYNVMVLSLDNSHEKRVKNVVFFATTVYKIQFYLDLKTKHKVGFSLEPIPFGIWAFKSGEFRNLGDGGYINWTWKGWHERYYTDYVRFFPPG